MKIKISAKPLLWKMFHVSLALALLAGFCCTALGAETKKARHNKRFNVGYRVIDLKYRSGQTEKALTVAVWYPTAASPKEFIYGGPTKGKVAVDAEPYAEEGPYPFLIFSHGYGGGGLAQVFFTEPLAAHGWIVAAPDYNDRHTAVRIHVGQKKKYDRMALWRHAEEIGASGPNDRPKYFYRLDELKLTLDKMLEPGLFGKFIDKERIAVGGHSFGGYTALGLCGTIKERRDDRIKAVLLFSSGAAGYLYTESELAAVKMPSMYLLGESEKTHERGTKNMAEIAEKVYRNLSPPKYFLEIKGANHFAFNNRFTRRLIARLVSGSDEEFEVIRRYGIAFLEKHVAGREDTAGVLDQQDPLLTRYVRELNGKKPLHKGNPSTDNEGG